jgi:hypothetical protein
VRLLARDDAAQAAVADEFVAPGAWISHLVLEIARKAGHSPLGTFDQGLARLPGAHKL